MEGPDTRCTVFMLVLVARRTPKRQGPDYIQSPCIALMVTGRYCTSGILLLKTLLAVPLRFGYFAYVCLQSRLTLLLGDALTTRYLSAPAGTRIHVSFGAC